MLQNIALPSAPLPEHSRIMLHHHLHYPDIADHCTTISCATQPCKALVHLHYRDCRTLLHDHLRYPDTAEHWSTITYITHMLQNIALPSAVLPRPAKHWSTSTNKRLQNIALPSPSLSRHCRTLPCHYLHYPDTAEHCATISSAIQSCPPPLI